MLLMLLCCCRIYCAMFQHQCFCSCAIPVSSALSCKGVVALRIRCGRCSWRWFMPQSLAICVCCPPALLCTVAQLDSCSCCSFLAVASSLFCCCLCCLCQEPLKWLTAFLRLYLMPDVPCIICCQWVVAPLPHSAWLLSFPWFPIILRLLQLLPRIWLVRVPLYPSLDLCYCPLSLLVSFTLPPC